MRNYKQLANSNDWVIRTRAALDNNCPNDILCKLILDRYFTVALSVINNKTIPVELINSYYDLRWMISGEAYREIHWFSPHYHWDSIIK